MKKFLKNQKGVTMIEVLVTIALLAVVVTPCLSAFVMAQRGNVKAAETQSAYTAAANLMEELKGIGKRDTFEEWERVVVYMIGQAQCIDNDGISVYSEKVMATYYKITIYAGEYDEQPEEVRGIEPILEGVIAW